MASTRFLTSWFRAALNMRMVLLNQLVRGPFLLHSSLVVQLRIAHDPTSLVGEIEGYALLEAQCYHEVSVRRDLALGQLQGLASALHGLSEPGPHRPHCMVSKRLPAFQRKPVGAVLLKLFAGQGDHAELEFVGQPDNHVDVAVPAEVRVVLVGPLEEYFVLELRQPLVGRPAPLG